VLTGSSIGVLTAVLIHWFFSTRLRSVPAFARG